MVFNGKPSSGCKLCRIRKVKCDEAKPFCMRCTKSKRHCPGYDAAILRAQEKKKKPSTAAAEKSVKKPRAQGSSSSTSDSTGGGVDPSKPMKSIETVSDYYHYSNTTAVRPRRGSTPNFRLGDKQGDLMSVLEMVPGGLMDSLDERASCLFLSEFVSVPLTPTARGYYAFLPRFLGSGTLSVCMSQAFKATSMAALAMRQTKGGRGPAMLRAQEYHIKALRAVGQAIADPKELRSDQTLGAVLMLAFYETLMSKDSLKEYISHLKGAAKIIQIRGQQCLETVEGKEMFAMTRNQCLSVQNLFKDADMSGYAWLVHNEAVNRSNRPTIDLSLLSSQVQQAMDAIMVTPTTDRATSAAAAIDRMAELLAKARKLETEFRKLHDRNPSSTWKVDTVGECCAREKDNDEEVEALDTAAAFDDRVYKFFNLPIAVLHLVTWCTHLNLITTIMRATAWLAAAAAVAGGDGRRHGEEEKEEEEGHEVIESSSHEEEDDEEELVRVATARVEDIVASVPYFCSWNGYGVIVSQFPCGTTKPDDPLKGEAGLIVMWPVAMAMKSDYATPRQRRYLRGRLRYIAHVSGISQARFFVNQA